MKYLLIVFLIGFFSQTSLSKLIGISGIRTGNVTKIVTKPDGTEITTYPDGTKVVIKPKAVY